MKSLFTVILIVSVVAPLMVYGVWFDRLSETVMVRLSYAWVPGILFGATGLMSRRRSLRNAMLAALLGLVLLFVFFETIWPKL